MIVSYKKLWKILIDKDMKKQDLQKAANVSWGVVSKLSKGETVNMESLIKICKALNCSVDDVMDILPDEVDEAKPNGTE
jgi:DNA-binding Xre family transcriptional regulator